VGCTILNATLASNYVGACLAACLSDDDECQRAVKESLLLTSEPMGLDSFYRGTLLPMLEKRRNANSAASQPQQEPQQIAGNSAASQQLQEPQQTAEAETPPQPQQQQQQQHQGPKQHPPQQQQQQHRRRRRKEPDENALKKEEAEEEALAAERDPQRRLRFLPLRDELERKERDESVRHVLCAATRSGAFAEDALAIARLLFRKVDTAREGTINRVQLSRYLSRDGSYVHPNELGDFVRDFGKEALNLDEFLTYLLENPHIAALCDDKIVIHETTHRTSSRFFFVVECPPLFCDDLFCCAADDDDRDLLCRALRHCARFLSCASRDDPDEKSTALLHKKAPPHYDASRSQRRTTAVGTPMQSPPATAPSSSLLLPLQGGDDDAEKRTSASRRRTTLVVVQSQHQ